MIVSTLGFPRIGPRRELKRALEQHWAGELSADELGEAAAGLRAATWARQRALGVTALPSNDFSLYDHVLDTAVMVGAILTHLFILHNAPTAPAVLLLLAGIVAWGRRAALKPVLSRLGLVAS